MRPLKSSAMPKRIHPNQPRTRKHPKHQTLTVPSAISATNQIILQMRVQAKAKLKPALRHHFTKIKASWRCGKVHSPTASNKNAPPGSSKPGAMTCAPPAIARYRLIIDVTQTTYLSPSIQTLCETSSVPHDS